ncbi:MAG: YjbE family putative metal transport protein [Chloroflexi bacterium]|nr:YjbE family putative metal transport protein [Chloroflexota bacterium]
MDAHLLSILANALSIVVLDLVLSGDNAVVIGLAARRLPPRQRRLAILLGGAGAIGLRVLFAALAAVLLAVPLLQAVGGVLLLWIAWKLLHDEGEEHTPTEGGTLFQALQTIILADAVMSLDNILAIAGVSHGDIIQLLLGLLLSMPIILSGSGLVAMLMNRLPWLVFVGAGILTWTAGGMIQEDAVVGQLIPLDGGFGLIVPLALTLAVLVPSVGRLVRTRPANRDLLAPVGRLDPEAGGDRPAGR